MVYGNIYLAVIHIYGIGYCMWHTLLKPSASWQPRFAAAELSLLTKYANKLTSNTTHSSQFTVLFAVCSLRQVGRPATILLAEHFCLRLFNLLHRCLARILLQLVRQVGRPSLIIIPIAFYYHLLVQLIRQVGRPALITHPIAFYCNLLALMIRQVGRPALTILPIAIDFNLLDKLAVLL